MANLLSIDFDIIMAPDINLYNGLIRNERTVNRLITEHPFLCGARADLEHYKKITLYLFNLIKTLPKENIRFSFNHEDIKYFLNNQKQTNVYNIDHHSDLGYGQPCDEYNCANWAKYYIDNQVIQNYTWIKNTSSDDKKEDINYKEVYLMNIDLNTYLPKIDYLFICLSPEWVPEQYYPLFYLIVEYFNQYYNTAFTIY